jgi:hypothetical protein
MKYSRQTLSIWIFRLLVAIGCGLMIASFIMPWWQASRFDVKSYTTNISVTNAITIYGFGLRHNLAQLASYIKSDVTPSYQTVLAWVYIGVSVCLSLVSAWLRGLKGTLLLGFIGLGYIVYAAAAGFLVIPQRLSVYGFALHGRSTISSAGAIITMQADLSPGYYLAFAAGGFFIILAIIRLILKRNN